jgi:hypothetical protein
MKHKIWQNLYTFKKNKNYSKIIQKSGHISATINTINKKFQKISFEIPLYKNMIFLAKGPQKGQ